MDDPWGWGMSGYGPVPVDTGLQTPVRAHAIGPVHTGPGPGAHHWIYPWDEGVGEG